MSVWVYNFGTVVGIIGSIVTIAGVPVTIWQIVSVKKKLKSTEDALKEYRDQEIAATFDEIIESVKQISAQILQLQNAARKQGYDSKGQMAQQSCNNMMIALNKCLDQLPSDQDKIERKIRDTMRSINSFGDFPTHVEFAYFDIKEVMTLLKKEQEKHNQNNLSMIAKASQ